MSLAENLQFLRAREGITQEQLAERLEVSRQSVSKWESSASYPEMDTLLRLCDMFHTDLDTLLRGSAEQSLSEDAAGYHKFMTAYARKVAGAVSGIIAGVALACICYGRGVPDMLAGALLLAFVAAGVVVLIASGIEEDNFRKQYPVLADFYTEKQKADFRRRYIWYIAGGVGAILFGVVLLCLAGYAIPRTEANDGLMTGVFLLIIAGAVFFLVCGGMLEDVYDIPKYNRRNNPTPEDRERRRRFVAAAAVIMLLATALYLFLGLAYGKWELAAAIYPVAAVLCGVARVLLGPKLEM